MADKTIDWNDDFLNNDPNEDTGLVKNTGAYINETREALTERLKDEHIWDVNEASPQTKMGMHKEGSGRGFVSDSQPSMRPDSSEALDSDDAGRIWFDTLNGTINMWNGTAWVDLSVAGSTPTILWDPAESYDQHSIVAYDDRLYLAVANPPAVGVAPAEPDWILFAQAHYMQNEWSSLTTYYAGDIVWYNNAWWYGIAPVVGPAPGTNVGEWALFSRPHAIANNWDPFATYSTGNVVWDSGAWWAAVAPVVGSQPGNVNGEWLLFALQHNIAKDWSLLGNYYAGNIVWYNGSWWYGIAPVVGSAPGAVAGEWGLFAKQHTLANNWDSYVPYSANQVVWYNNLWWRGVAPVTGSAPGAVSGEWIEAYLPADWGLDGVSNYGEELPSGYELLLDGSPSAVTSKGRYPSQFVGTIYASSKDENVKWPGSRGNYFFSKEGENLLDNPALVTKGWVRATEDDIAGWKRLTNTGTSSFYANYHDFQGTNNRIFCSVRLRRGNTPSALSIVYARDELATASAYVSVNWTTKAFTASNCTDYSYFVDDNECVIAFTTDDLGVIMARMDITPDGGTTVGGEVGYYKDPFVHARWFYTPYHESAKRAGVACWPIRWEDSNDWTLECWFKPNGITSTHRLLFDAVFDTSTGFSSFAVFWDQTGWALYSSDAGSAGFIYLSGIVENTWNHIKVIFSSGAYLNAYVNGGAVQSKTTNIPDVENLDHALLIGDNAEHTLPFNGFITDFAIYPGIDTSNTHYNSGLPYRNPEKIYTDFGNTAISQYDVAGDTSNTGRIIYDDIIDGWYVTKYDTGVMTIWTEQGITVDTTIATGSLFRNDPSLPAARIDYPVIFVGDNPHCSAVLTYTFNNVAASPFNSQLNYCELTIFSTTSVTNNIVYVTVKVTGRWK